MRWVKLILVKIKCAFNLIHPSKSLWALGLDDHSTSSLDTKKEREGMRDSFFFIHEIWRAEREERRNRRPRESSSGHDSQWLYNSFKSILYSTNLEEFYGHENRGPYNNTYWCSVQQWHEFRGILYNLLGTNFKVVCTARSTKIEVCTGRTIQQWTRKLTKSI